MRFNRSKNSTEIVVANIERGIKPCANDLPVRLSFHQTCGVRNQLMSVKCAKKSDISTNIWPNICASAGSHTINKELD